MSLELFAFAALFAGATLLTLTVFKPRIHWGHTLVSALLAGSLFLAAQYWLVSLRILSFESRSTSGFFIDGIPLEMALVCIAAPVFFAVVWQTAKQKVKS